MTWRLLRAISIIAVTACARSYIDPAPNGVVLSSGRLGVYTKEVMTKKDPDTLVANDATICRVSPDLYRSTKLHSMVQCNWQ